MKTNEHIVNGLLQLAKKLVPMRWH